ncbi:uncharacterized protein L969DRAFT_44294 [Mixia osmundae IAM 14324]|uniref:DH domain-containing protein n=1 Tax=Mixia osmundae (strain CBS 9802 / IAM 14324 / JCM 22182 / KY 12970) TaxID=764103 RepID=G7E3X3_MIXOS|nr:uncharacterized protein L969DRAFT_44294 [Mixia osmundae IAM 14324]KEI41978.1 hypothetical protein L969DRAFT_44294 [Mixia osmundae IAM 14324]GAA97533.1 hypothetical protein E5Q_04211 [Mixia osmundae IAM 14324]
MTTLTGGKLKRRAIFCDVVCEGMTQDGAGWTVPERTAHFLQQLGDPLPAFSPSDAFASTALASQPSFLAPSTRPHNPAELENRLRELVETEFNYVRRLKALIQDYARPLRDFAKHKEKAIIPLYEAKMLFGNIDVILAANEGFLQDLERVMLSKRRGGLGVVIWEHLTAFADVHVYPTYLSGYEKAKEIESQMSSKRGFVDFVERTKYSTEGIGNIGLRELLMEPVQRVTRYILMLEGILGALPADDSENRDYLLEAHAVASQMARCEADEPERCAAAMWGLERAIEGFPANMISSSRYFVDCLDVMDSPRAANGSNSPASAASRKANALNCTLFLFSDCLMIAKRPSSSGPDGRSLAGLENIDQLAKVMKMHRSGSQIAYLTKAYEPMGSTPTKVKKDCMGFKGLIKLEELIAADEGDDEISLWLQNPPTLSSAKWSGRPSRSYIVRAASDAAERKTRFLDRLWQMQANIKTIEARSTAMVTTLAHLAGPPGQSADQHISVYWNLYEKRAYLSEPIKSRLVLQVDPTGESDSLSFGRQTGPAMIARIAYHDDCECSIEIQLANHGLLHSDRSVRYDSAPHSVIATARDWALYEGALRLDQSVAASTATSPSPSMKRLSEIDVRKVFSSPSAPQRRSKSIISKASSAATDSSAVRSEATSATAASFATCSSMSASTSQTSLQSSARIGAVEEPRKRLDSVSPTRSRASSTADYERRALQDITGQEARALSLPCEMSPPRPAKPEPSLSLSLSRTPSRRAPGGPRGPRPFGADSPKLAACTISPRADDIRKVSGGMKRGLSESADMTASKRAPSWSREPSDDSDVREAQTDIAPRGSEQHAQLNTASTDRAIQEIRTEVHALRGNLARELAHKEAQARAGSPGLPRSPQSRNLARVGKSDDSRALDLSAFSEKLRQIEATLDSLQSRLEPAQDDPMLREIDEYRTALADSLEQNAKLRRKMRELEQEKEALYEVFNEDLDRLRRENERLKHKLASDPR